MKTLSLTQPWATLVASGAKRIETRSWGTSYRGPLAIHAAKTFPKWAKELCEDEIFAQALKTADWKNLPLGMIIAKARLIACVRLDSTLFGLTADDLFRKYHLPHEPEYSFGDYSLGRYAWVLDDIEGIEPVPAKGNLGLWDWDDAGTVMTVEAADRGRHELAERPGG